MRLSAYLCIAAASLAAEDAAPTAPTPTTTPPAVQQTATATPEKKPLTAALGKPAHPAKADEPKSPFHMGLVIDGGYDSNVLLLPDTSSGTGATRDGSPAFGFEGRLDWKLWQSQRGNIKIGGIGRIDSYSDASIDSISRYGGNLVGSWVNASRTWCPGFAASVTGYQVDGDSVANDGFFRFSVANCGDLRVDVASVDVQRIVYTQSALDERSGLLMAGTLRHWFLFEKGVLNRRAELGFRAGQFHANEDWQSYTTVRPDVTFTWLWGSDGSAHNVRLSVNSGVEWRSYQETASGQTDEEKQTNWDSSASVMYYMAKQAMIGPYAGYSRRLDNQDAHSYNRWLAGVRLQVDLP